MNQPPDADDSEIALLEAARAGDAAALEALLARYQDRIFSFGIKMCGNPEDAKEVLQETLFAMARGIGSFRGASSLTTWLYTIARSFCIKLRRRPTTDQREPLAAEQVSSALPGSDPEGSLQGRELRHALAAALAELEPAAREVWLLRDMEGLTAAEVAEVTGTSVEAVKSRLHRTRVAVRERLLPWTQGAASPKTSRPNCPDILAQFSKHLEGDVDATTCATMERHLAGCPGCRETCDTLKQTLALCRSSGAAKVPDEIARAVREAVRSTIAGT